MEKELTAAVTTQEPMLADRLIVVQQLPIIKEQLHSIKAKLLTLTQDKSRQKDKELER